MNEILQKLDVPTISEQRKKEMIVEIAAARPQAVLTPGNPTEGIPDILTISLPYECYIDGLVNKQEKTAKINLFQTNTRIANFSKVGIGSRLMRVFVAEAKALGAERIEGGSLISLSALRTRVKVFGKENVFFFLHDMNGVYPIGFEEAEKKIKFNEGARVSREQVEARCDLSRVDTSGWERPVY
ncbi:MAG: hypothetical protein UT32_C0007G0036 [Parcubacteria group bacterium GW2011_GWC2_39_14]|nr:MAG: hypothetical protein UT32_C0007G0036 [Parcubacteria group bacterium GW2011_GWC2_39_14]KKR55009.1 MAG: hypothetical protein UT91_C0005G0010 [Parcubacteria group bacterium GW2011_GWA2_40_23]